MTDEQYAAFLWARDRAKQYKKFARAGTNRRRLAPEPCYVCNEHTWLAELHHIVPVSEYADLISRIRCSRRELPANYLAWLCPNHHAMAHKLLPYWNDWTLQMLDDNGEWERFVALMAIYTDLKAQLIAAQTP